MKTTSRRQVLARAASIGLAGPFLSAALAGSRTGRAQVARGRDGAQNPLGSRWPQPDERYFYGRAADRREMQRANAEVTPGDVDGFVATWTTLARQHELEGDAAKAAGRGVTARDHFLRASNYHSQVQNLFLRLGRADDWRDAHARMRTAFTRAWQAAPAPFEAIEIPYNGTRLAGFFFPASSATPGRRPTVLELNGIDHHKERIFFRSDWIPYVERGVNLVTMDGPGQGECLAQGVYLRADSEQAARAALDHLTIRPDVDPTRLGVFGTSFGGYFAPRAAAADRRIRAMASRSSVYDALEDVFDFSPPLREQLRMLVNAKTIDEARDRLRPFTLRDVARGIRCPVFVTHGSRDDVVSVESAKKLDAQITSPGKRIVIVDGAGHNPGPESEAEQIDWLADLLSRGTPGRNPGLH